MGASPLEPIEQTAAAAPRRWWRPAGSGQQLAVLHGHYGPVYSAVFDPHGEHASGTLTRAAVLGCAKCGQLGRTEDER
jgi:hypothetical protein